jgi:hypothetical protein
MQPGNFFCMVPIGGQRFSLLRKVVTIFPAAAQRHVPEIREPGTKLKWHLKNTFAAFL